MQASEPGIVMRRIHPTLSRHRVLVFDSDPGAAMTLRNALGTEYAVDFSDEIEEAEAMFSNVFYAVAIVQASALGSSRRAQFEFVRFIALQSERTRVVLLDEQRGSGDDDGGLGFVVDVVLPKTVRPSTLALLVSELSRAP